MKKYDFNNPQVFEQLEDKAIDGQLDYSFFPPPEYKYFSRLAKVGYNNRHKGWDINICLEWQDKLRTEYKRDRNNADEYRMLSQRIMDNVKKSAENVKRIIEIDGSKSNEATVCDMQEIKHGSWEYDSEGVGYANYLCSECGNFLTFYEDIDLYPYCPYCGAKMDKEREVD